MAVILGVIYILFILFVVFISFFIVTRLQEYSINPRFTKPLVIFFILFTVFLVAINFALFISIPFDEMFFNNFYF